MELASLGGVRSEEMIRVLSRASVLTWLRRGTGVPLMGLGVRMALERK